MDLENGCAFNSSVYHIAKTDGGEKKKVKERGRKKKPNTDTEIQNTELFSPMHSKRIGSGRSDFCTYVCNTTFRGKSVSPVSDSGYNFPERYLTEPVKYQ